MQGMDKCNTAPSIHNSLSLHQCMWASNMIDAVQKNRCQVPGATHNAALKPYHATIHFYSEKKYQIALTHTPNVQIYTSSLLSLI